MVLSRATRFLLIHFNYKHNNHAGVIHTSKLKQWEATVRRNHGICIK